MRVVRTRTEQLSPQERTRIRELLDAAFVGDERGGFTDDDWRHALGGLHVLATSGDQLLAHASVVERELHVAGMSLRTGYVEAVATAPDHQRLGIGSAVMRAVNEHVDATYELGALGTGSHGFYERLGWETWRGPSSVRIPAGERPTPDEDGYIMVRRTPRTPPLDPEAPISCEWRPGDVW